MITLEGNPLSTNQIYRRHGHIIYMKTDAKHLKESYQWQAKSQWKKKPLKDDISVEIKIYFSDRRKRDWDNYHKLTMDSLTSIVWVDDSQIKKAYVQLFYDKMNPRTEIIVNSIAS